MGNKGSVAGHRPKTWSISKWMSDSHGMGLKFEELNDDILNGLFKYLSLQEKLRYERVSTRWAHIIADVWAQEHELELIQFKFISVSRKRVISDILNRSSSLKQFKTLWEHSAVSLDSWDGFGKELASMCPLLESVTVGDKLWLDIMLEYVDWADEINVKEVAFVGYINETAFQPWLQMLKACLKIESLVINAYRTFDVSQLGDILPKLKHLSVSDAQVFTFPVLQMLTNLEKLALFERNIEESEVQLICNNLLTLKSIRIKSTFVNIKHLSLLKDLEAVHWEVEDKETADEGQHFLEREQVLRYFIESKGRQLKSISFDFDFKFAPPSLSVVIDLCHDLEKLSVTGFGVERGEDHFRRISQLKKLKHLGFKFPCYRGQGLNQILSDCPKLRVIDLTWWVSQLDAQLIVTQLEKYAAAHPKRRVYSYLTIMPTSVSSTFVLVPEVISSGNLRLNLWVPSFD